MMNKILQGACAAFAIVGGAVLVVSPFTNEVQEQKDQALFNSLQKEALKALRTGPLHAVETFTTSIRITGLGNAKPNKVDCDILKDNYAKALSDLTTAQNSLNTMTAFSWYPTDNNALLQDSIKSLKSVLDSRTVKKAMFWCDAKQVFPKPQTPLPGLK